MAQTQILVSALCVDSFIFISIVQRVKMEPKQCSKMNVCRLIVLHVCCCCCVCGLVEPSYEFQRDSQNKKSVRYITELYIQNKLTSIFVPPESQTSELYHVIPLPFYDNEKWLQIIFCDRVKIHTVNTVSLFSSKIKHFKRSNAY